MIKVFPTLYKLTSGKKLQEWTITAESDGPNRAWTFTTFGQTDGKIQQSEPTACVSQNVGKSNATTAEEQALLEAEAQWTKKLKKDYVKTQEEALAGKASDLVEGGILPMLAHKFSESAHKIVYPALAQPKLDGHRCIAVVDHEGKCTLWSRTRKLINSAPHIVKQLEDMKLRNVCFDGELYSGAYKEKFEELTSLIRQGEAKEGCEAIEYHIYDVPDTEAGSFNIRNGYLKEFFFVNISPASQLKEVETIKVNDEDELMLAFDKFVAEGYEGAIVRNAAGLYVNKRSYDLQKIKEFDDAEFIIIGVEEGKGKLAGKGIFVCMTPEGRAFQAKMKGKIEDLKKYFDNPEKYIDKMLTVQFQGKTAYGIPRFPVALRIQETV